MEVVGTDSSRVYLYYITSAKMGEDIQKCSRDDYSILFWLPARVSLDFKVEMGAKFFGSLCPPIMSAHIEV